MKEGNKAAATSLLSSIPNARPVPSAANVARGATKGIIAAGKTNLGIELSFFID